jgi:hypothetical protein
MIVPDDVIDELRETFRTRPTEGTARECRAWVNGFREALEAFGVDVQIRAGVADATTLDGEGTRR